MNYPRVIPRDFFNEAKLLKCMGQLALKILDGMIPQGINIVIDESQEGFEVRMLRDGCLTVINYPVTINGISVTFKTTYNSKSNFPLYAEYHDTDYEVFDEDGNLTAEFTETFMNLKL